MTRKPTRRQTVSIRNKDLLNSSVFTEVCGGSMPVFAIVCELAYDSGFLDLLATFHESPGIVHRMADTAHTALRGLKNLDSWQKKNKMLLH